MKCGRTTFILQYPGRDSFGQQVASGVYFYTLQAGKFKAMRKMAILK